MKISPTQTVLACVALVGATLLGHLLIPRQSMAVSAESFDLQKVVPTQFGGWKADPAVRLIEPPSPDSLARQLYSQEIARAYRDREGHLVMFLVAYGPTQTARLQLHRPEICYTAEGFRVSQPVRASVAYGDGASPLALLRLVARRESRLEPISYWTRVGDEISNGVVNRQITRLKLALRGKIADGALMRVSTIGLPEAQAYDIQDRFIRDFYDALAPRARGFFFGGERKELMQAQRQ
jgi:EpsI family protein